MSDSAASRSSPSNDSAASRSSGDLGILNAGYNYNAPLAWRHDDGCEGTEVSQIPQIGRVYFFDPHGPVLRLDNVREARWLNKIIHFHRSGETLQVRITRLAGEHEGHPGDGYFFVLPNPGQPIVLHCTRDRAHDGCAADTCLLLEGAVKKWIETPIVEALTLRSRSV